MKIKRKEKQMLEAEKAKRFAYWYFILRDAGCAARKVGEPEENGILFLSERRVAAQLKYLRKQLGEESAGELAKLGLCRILFSEPKTDIEGNLLAGFSLQKYGAGKGGEYQFWDKVKACELLLKLEEQQGERAKDLEKQEDFTGILGALQKGADALAEE